MTLTVDLFSPEHGDYSYLNAIENDAAGFESYRLVLWGSKSLTSRGARFLGLRDFGWVPELAEIV